MPSVFTDEAGSRDLTITTSADWTVDSAVLPNGDDAVHGDGSIAKTYNIVDMAFDLRTGTWTVEYWIWTTGVASNMVIVSCGAPGSATGTRWQSYLNPSTQIVFGTYNTSGNAAKIQTTGAISTSAWHHIVCTKPN